MYKPLELDINVSYDTAAALWKGRINVQYHKESLRRLSWSAYAWDADRSNIMPKLNYELVIPGSEFVRYMLTADEWHAIYSRVQIEKAKYPGSGWFSVWARWSSIGMDTIGSAGPLGHGLDPLFIIESSSHNQASHTVTQNTDFDILDLVNL